MNLQSLPEEALKEILALTEAKKRLDLRDKAQDYFMPFAHHVYDNFIEGRHHRIIAEKLEKVARGELKRLIINMPPRHSKSEFASYLMPAWFLGRNPKLKIIQATHNTELAVRFGRKVRDLIDDPQYKDIFPDTSLKEDNKGAGKWQTSAGGEYFAAGVGAAVTGRGADLFVQFFRLTSRYGLSSGKKTLYCPLKLRCLYKNGTLSGNRLQLRLILLLSSENGGKIGKRTRFPQLSTFCRRMTLRFPRKKRRITLL